MNDAASQSYGREETETTSEDLDIYGSVVSSLGTKIRWKPVVRGVQRIWDELSNLSIYFIGAQEGMTRHGIIQLLERISTYEAYKRFFDMLEELMRVEIKPEQDMSGEGPYTFFYFIYKNPQQSNDVLECAYKIYTCFKNNTTCKILKYLFALGNFVTGSALDQPGTGNYINFFLRRAEIFLQGFAYIKGNLTDARNLQSVNWPADWRDRGGSIVPTDGDMHCGGKLPYIIEYAGQKYVYKPRDMSMDFWITNALSFFNEFLDEEIKLPVYQIHLFGDDTGLMSFAEHADDMNEEQAQAYFKKFGALLYFAKLFGIEDLHYENIMATDLGPVIIDMECALCPNYIKRKDIATESLKKLLNCFDRKKEANAVFKVEGAIPYLKGWPGQFILDGFAKAAECCRNNKDELRNYYMTSFSKSFYYRIVPMATEEFYGHMYGMIGICMDKNRIDIALDIICSQIINGLHAAWFNSVQIEEFKNCLCNDILSNAIYTAMFWGEIPYFQVKADLNAEGIVFYKGFINGKPFMKKAVAGFEMNALEQEFCSQIDWLDSVEAKQSVEKWIGPDVRRMDAIYI